MICGHCGASFRRRTEREKVVWRCATRMEKGREECIKSPTLKEIDVKKKILEFLGKESDFEEVEIKQKIHRIKVINKNDMLIDYNF